MNRRNRLHGGILEVTNRYEDGRCDILTVGRENLSGSLSSSQKKPLMRGAVDFRDRPAPLNSLCFSRADRTLRNLPHAGF